MKMHCSKHCQSTESKTLQHLLQAVVAALQVKNNRWQHSCNMHLAIRTKSILSLSPSLPRPRLSKLCGQLGATNPRFTSLPVCKLNDCCCILKTQFFHFERIESWNEWVTVSTGNTDKTHSLTRKSSSWSNLETIFCNLFCKIGFPFLQYPCFLIRYAVIWHVVT